MTHQDQIRHLKARIADLSERLPYADGQAYYDDKRKIQALDKALQQLIDARRAAISELTP